MKLFSLVFLSLCFPLLAALVYYSGHGIEQKDINYLLPVDVTLDSAAQLRSRADTLRTDLKATGAPARTVILDCCRDNPCGTVVKNHAQQRRRRRVRAVAARRVRRVPVGSWTAPTWMAVPGVVS